MLLKDFSASASHRCARDNILELADIAKPMVVCQEVHNRMGNARILLKKCFCQQGNIPLSLTKGRNVNGERIDPKIKILSEFSFRNEHLEILIRSHDNSDINDLCLRRSDDFDLSLGISS